MLAGIAEELGAPLGFRTVAEVRAEMEEMGRWDGARAGARVGDAPRSTRSTARRAVALATWKQLLDNGSMQDGEEHLAATARAAVARRLRRAVYDAHSAPSVTVTGDRGSVTLPVEVADLRRRHRVGAGQLVRRGVLADLASPGSSRHREGSDQ